MARKGRKPRERNLCEGSLGAVIVHVDGSQSLKDSISRRSFCLPQRKYEHKQKIREGLVIFVFDFSSRLLHGVFEAVAPASRDQPQRVAVRVRNLFEPIAESLFRNVIEDNYYNSSSFFLELDNQQTSNLIELFAKHPGLSTMSRNLYQDLIEPKAPTFNATPSGNSADGRTEEQALDKRRIVTAVRIFSAEPHKFVEPTNKTTVKDIERAASVTMEQVTDKASVGPSNRTVEDMIRVETVGTLEDMIRVKTGGKALVFVKENRSNVGVEMDTVKASIGPATGTVEDTNSAETEGKAPVFVKENSSNVGVVGDTIKASVGPATGTVEDRSSVETEDKAPVFVKENSSSAGVEVDTAKASVGPATGTVEDTNRVETEGKAPVFVEENSSSTGVEVDTVKAASVGPATRTVDDMSITEAEGKAPLFVEENSSNPEVEGDTVPLVQQQQSTALVNLTQMVLMLTQKCNSMSIKLGMVQEDMREIRVRVTDLELGGLEGWMWDEGDIVKMSTNQSGPAKKPSAEPSNKPTDEGPATGTVEDMSNRAVEAVTVPVIEEQQNNALTELTHKVLMLMKEHDSMKTALGEAGKEVHELRVRVTDLELGG